MGREARWRRYTEEINLINGVRHNDSGYREDYLILYPPGFWRLHWGVGYVWVTLSQASKPRRLREVPRH